MSKLRLRKTGYFYLALIAPALMSKKFHDKVVIRYKIGGENRVITFREIV